MFTGLGLNGPLRSLGNASARCGPCTVILKEIADVGPFRNQAVGGGGNVQVGVVARGAQIVQLEAVCSAAVVSGLVGLAVVIVGTLAGGGGVGNRRRRQQGDFKPVGAVGVVVLGSVVGGEYVGGGAIYGFRTFGADGDVVRGGGVGLVFYG